MTGAEDESVGSVAEEAAKLLHALQDWARESGSEYGDATAGAAGVAASMAQQVNEHFATGDATCTYCPLCKVIAAVRSTSPEVRQHLSVAATSLIHAAAELMATDVAAASDRHESPTTTKIDLDDEWEDD